MDVLKRNNVRILGKGNQYMVFANGFGCDQNVWRHIISDFTDQYKIVLFDYVGTGNSDLTAYKPSRYTDLKDYARDLVEIGQALDLKDAIFVGHSVSAMIGVLAHNQIPAHYSKLILIGPSPCYINKGEYFGGFEQEDIEELMEVLASNYLGWSSNLAPAIMGNPERPELGEELTNSFCQMDPEIAENFAKITFLSDNRADLEKVVVPTAIFQCSDDIIAPQKVGQYLENKIPKSRLYLMNARGHCPHLSAPQETITLIKQFLN